MVLRLSLSDYEAAIDAAEAAISAGGLVIYPTDTLYGIGCDALLTDSIEKIYSLKKREGRKPLSILVSNYAMLRKYCAVDGRQDRILQALLPGPYTFILQLHHRLPVSDGMEVGVRVPDHHLMREVSKRLQLPIVTTSANLSGQKDASEPGNIPPEIANGADLLIDGGRCQYAQGSTVIDLIRMKILRKGAVRQGDVFEWEK